MSCPHTVAIVMDGNRRWAKKNNLPSASGHRKGIETLIDIVKTAKNNSIKRFLKEDSVKHFPAKGEASISGVIVEVSKETGLALKIKSFITGGALNNTK